MSRATQLARLALVSIVLSSEGCGMNVMSEVHVLPDGYVGPVVILYDQPNREEPARDQAGALVYRIPVQGVLCVSNPAPRAGLYRKQFYYESKDGRRQELPHRAHNQVVQVFSDGYGVTEVLDGKQVGGIRWLAYIVGTPGVGSDWSQLRDAAVERAIRTADTACGA